MSAAWPASWPPAARPPSRRARPCTGSAGTTSFRLPISCLRREMLPEGEKALGIKINFETVNAQRPAAAHHRGDPVGRRSRPVHAQQQPSAALCRKPRRPGRRGRGAGQGRGRPLSARASRNSNDGKKWLSMPLAIIGGMIAYRKSWFDEVGANEFPDTWEEYREVGKKLKAKGRPIGQTLGHTFGDAPTFSYPLHVVVGRQGGRRKRQGGRSTARRRSTRSSS